MTDIYKNINIKGSYILLGKKKNTVIWAHHFYLFYFFVTINITVSKSAKIMK